MMDLLIDSQFLIDISCDSMHISCQKCCHADWDCNSLPEGPFSTKRPLKLATQGPFWGQGGSLDP